MENIWVLIPLAAIAAGAFREWTKVQSKQRELGSSTDDLERAVAGIKAELKERQAALEKRIANLETIVTSQTWDTLHDSSLSAEEKQLLVGGTHAELEALRRDVDDTHKAEVLAQRMK